MTVLILALVAGLFALGGLLGAAVYGLTALVRLAWSAAVPPRTPWSEQKPPRCSARADSDFRPLSDRRRSKRGRTGIVIGPCP